MKSVLIVTVIMCSVAPDFFNAFNSKASAACSGDINAGCSQVNSVLGGKAPIVSGQTGVLLNTLGGSKGDGTDAISKFNINGVQNVKEFGATGSATTATATTSSGNMTVTVNSIGDFAVNQWVKIDHAGAASNANTPTAVTIVPNSYGINPNPTSDITKTIAIGGGCQTDSATGIPGHNTACNVSYTYQIVGVSQGGGWSAPTASVSTSVGPATLSTNNNLLVSWTGATNDIAYLIYQCSGASCTPTLHAIVPHMGAPGCDRGELSRIWSCIWYR